jgi:hypothetical protein
VLLADAQGVYREIGKTEMINNNLDPKYAQIVLGFLFAHFVFSKKKKKKGFCVLPSCFFFLMVVLAVCQVCDVGVLFRNGAAAQVCRLGH